MPDQSSLKAFFLGGVVIPILMYLASFSSHLFAFFMGSLTTIVIIYATVQYTKHAKYVCLLLGLDFKDRTSSSNLASADPSAFQTPQKETPQLEAISASPAVALERKDSKPSLRKSSNKSRIRVRNAEGKRSRGKKPPKSPSRLRDEFSSDESIGNSTPTTKPRSHTTNKTNNSPPTREKHKSLTVSPPPLLLNDKEEHEAHDERLSLSLPLPESSEHVLKEGWISLQWNTGVKRIWNKRYFVLKKNGWLSYYANKNWPKACYAHICLHNASVKVYKEKKNTKKFKFQLQENSKRPIYHRRIPGDPAEPMAGSQIWRYKSSTVYLRTRSQEDRDAWVRAIRDVAVKYAQLNSRAGHQRSFSAGWVDVDEDTESVDDDSATSLRSKPGSAKSSPPDSKSVEELSSDSGEDDETIDSDEEVEEDLDSEAETIASRHARRSSDPLTVRTCFPDEESEHKHPPETKDSEKSSSSSSSDKGSSGFLSVLKNAVGMDITKISMPVSYFEPTSFLQRLCEVSQYYYLLDKADMCDNSLQAMTYFAAYAVSYHACNTRTLKPFNPYLGETFEFVDGDFRFFAEQVSHHPPIGAMIAENAHFRLDRDQGVKTRFGGNYLDVSPTGTTEVRLKRLNHTYSYNFIRAKVHNIIFGTMYVDQYGEMNIRNLSTGDSAALTFTQCGWLGRGQYQVKGVITDGRTKVKIGGKWNESVRLVDGGGLDWGDVTEGDDLWRHSMQPIKTNKYGVTEFVMKMNDMTGKYFTEPLPNTDSRFREDRKAMEREDKEAAEIEKTKLENQQRALRREREEKGEQWVPIYFEEMKNNDGVTVWRYRGNYKDWK